MAELGAKRVRKNRTLAARIEEIQEKFGREPTKFELRALAEFPLQKELYDTSENGRRIHELLELSERTRDVSYLQEAGELITFQARRDPYAIEEPKADKKVEEEVETVEVKYTTAGTSYPEKSTCYSPPQRVRRPAPTPSPSQTTALYHPTIPRNINHLQSTVSRPTNTLPPISNILSISASYARTLPLHPPSLPFSPLNYPAQAQLPPIQNAATPSHQISNTFGGLCVGAHGAVPPGAVPNYGGWHPFQPSPYYPTTSPQAYSLSNGSANSNTFHVPYHTAGLPRSSRAGLKPPAGSQLPSIVLPNVQVDSNSHHAVSVPSSSISPLNQALSNGFTSANLPPVIRSGLQPSPYSSQAGGMQSSLTHLARQAISSNFAVKLPPPLPLPNGQINPHNNTPEASQSFRIIPRNYAKSNNQPAQQSSAAPLNAPFKPRNPLQDGKKRGHDEFTEDDLARATDGREESLPKKKSRRE